MFKYFLGLPCMEGTIELDKQGSILANLIETTRGKNAPYHVAALLDDEVDRTVCAKPAQVLSKHDGCQPIVWKHKVSDV